MRIRTRALVTLVDEVLVVISLLRWSSASRASSASLFSFFRRRNCIVCTGRPGSNFCVQIELQKLKILSGTSTSMNFGA